MMRGEMGAFVVKFVTMESSPNDSRRCYNDLTSEHLRVEIANTNDIDSITKLVKHLAERSQSDESVRGLLDIAVSKKLKAEHERASMSLSLRKVPESNRQQFELMSLHELMEEYREFWLYDPAKFDALLNYAQVETHAGSTVVRQYQMVHSTSRSGRASIKRKR